MSLPKWANISPLLAMLGFLSIIAGCERVSYADLIGTYHSSDGCPGEILTLSRNGAFRHKYNSHAYNGHWQIYEADNEINIWLSPFKEWNNKKFGNLADRLEVQTFSAPVSKWFNDLIVISVDEDHGCSFSK